MRTSIQDKTASVYDVKRSAALKLQAEIHK